MIEDLKERREKGITGDRRPKGPKGDTGIEGLKVTKVGNQFVFREVAKLY